LNFIVGFLLVVYSYNTEYESDADVRHEIEEQVFWTLVAIIEDILPIEMYGRDLKGCQVLQAVLWRRLIPDFHLELGLGGIKEWLGLEDENIGMHRRTATYPLTHSRSNLDLRSRQRSDSAGLELITTQWFLTLYLNSFPAQSVLRIWDCLMLYVCLD
jgi:hypothetical protein